MSHREKRTINLGNGGTYEQDYTVHADEIAAMRQRVADIMAEYPNASEAPRVAFLEATICQAAAALLEVHDDTGISLDNWVGPREVVETALMTIGLPRETFLENHV